MTSALSTPRRGASGALLHDGRFLVTGGMRGSDSNLDVLRSAELYAVTGGQLPPRLLSIDPPAAATTGGQTVRIIGAGLFHPDTAVTFGDREARLTFVSENEINAVVPPHPQGVVTVKVTTPGGTSAPGPSALFTYGAGSWSATGASGEGRDLHGAALLDGPKCHTEAPPPYCGKVLVAGGAKGIAFERLSSAELYDPAEGRWANTASLQMPGRCSRRRSCPMGG